MTYETIAQDTQAQTIARAAKRAEQRISDARHARRAADMLAAQARDAEHYARGCEMQARDARKLLAQLSATCVRSDY